LKTREVKKDMDPRKTEWRKHYVCTCKSLNYEPKVPRTQEEPVDETAEVVDTDKDEKALQGDQ
jgi:hypothetical protein